jgi:hypothetical protein
MDQKYLHAVWLFCFNGGVPAYYKRPTTQEAETSIASRPQRQVQFSGSCAWGWLTGILSPTSSQGCEAMVGAETMVSLALTLPLGQVLSSNSCAKCFLQPKKLLCIQTWRALGRCDWRCTSDCPVTLASACGCSAAGIQ